MLNRIARYTWPMRILFFAVYFVLFSVQLYFKYSAVPTANTGIDLDATALHFQLPSTGITKCVSKFNRTDSYSIKVSKRYLHQNAFEMDSDAPVTGCATFPVQEQIVHKTITLHEFFFTDTFLRGPPATV